MKDEEHPFNNVMQMLDLLKRIKVQIKKTRFSQINKSEN